MFPRKSIVVFACLVLLSALGRTLHRIEQGKPGYLGDLVHANVGNTGQEQKSKEVVKQEPKKPLGEPCSKNIEWLANVDLNYPIHYAERDIIVRPTANTKRKALNNVSEILFPQARLDGCPPPLVLEVPDTPTTPVNASQMHFGIATTMQRLEESTPYIARWLRDTRAKLFVVIITPEEGVPPTSQEMAMK
ncbi:MAG: hypothetical protein L6R42_009835 [Xanthoria sp. 1 TBL-2021]|nr:MAG: hypothetical protein L6R42_009835 [Xanthoria sp. 1 TBL-2021]